MSYVLRDYQQKASDAAVSFFANRAKKNNAIMVLPTGAGKSLVIADIASRLEGHTLVFQPSKEILEQNYLKLCSYGILDCSIYSASFGRKEISRITFATIGSVINHPELFQHFHIDSSQGERVLQLFPVECGKRTDIFVCPRYGILGPVVL